MTELPEWARVAQQQWHYDGSERPEFAEQPGDGEESVWDYPRPPKLLPDQRQVIVRCGGVEIARTSRSIRILETAGAPTFYIPPVDLNTDFLHKHHATSRCEWKGIANYWNAITANREIEQAGWSYMQPFSGFEDIRGYIAFYPAKLSCYVDGEQVRPQPGGLYGGWVTDEIVGPIKGEPGSGNW